MAAAIRNDRHAWWVLIQRHQRWVFTVARQFYQLDEDTQKEVVAVVWEKLYRSLGTIADPARLRGWLKRTTYNAAVDILRKTRREIPTEFSHEEADVSMPAPDEVVFESETKRALVRAFNALSAMCQRLLRVLFESDTPSYEDVTDILGMRQGSIGPTRQRCLEALARQFDVADQMRDPGDEDE